MRRFGFYCWIFLVSLTFGSGSVWAQTYHVVREKETLYGIARTYGLSLEDLVALNNLKGYNIEIGQRLKIDTLIVRTKVDSLASPIVEVSEEKAKKKEDLFTPQEGLYSHTDNDIQNFYKRLDSLCQVHGVSFEANLQEGFVAPIEEDQTKEIRYYALHRSLPVGTIVKVENQINHRLVTVRVIGKLPDVDA
ncbi:MAG: LysM peptidoglycan-binding domain-containing protein, partial [Cytophagales bacterium]|nr:LysM peptidoglycan-binding domain-containing protein [Cytophagales bacterium]